MTIEGFVLFVVLLGLEPGGAWRICPVDKFSERARRREGGSLSSSTIPPIKKPLHHCKGFVLFVVPLGFICRANGPEVNRSCKYKTQQPCGLRSFFRQCLTKTSFWRHHQKKTTPHISVRGFLLDVVPHGLEPWTPWLWVSKDTYS